MSKQLQQNQTDINQRLSVYDGQIANITLQVNFTFEIILSFMKLSISFVESIIIINCFVWFLFYSINYRSYEIYLFLIVLFLSYLLKFQVNNLGTRLTLIEKKINENKDLISSSDATKSVNVLPEVAKLGSNYRDLSDSVKSLKDITNSLKLYQTILSSNITSINVSNNNLFFFFMINNY